MISRKDLLECFSVVEENEKGYYFFQHNLPQKIYTYSLKNCGKNDFLTVSENLVDRDFAMFITSQAPESLSRDKPSLYKIPVNTYGFTHGLVVPSSYHSALKNRLEKKRKNLFLCIPIFECEFSGDESEAEFREMIARNIPVFEWRRTVFPKLKVYFDNPQTGAGTDESGVLMKYHTLVSEIKNLNGVGNGFIEITNFQNKVIEVLSPSEDMYILIENRTREINLNFLKLLEAVSKFSGSELVNA